VIIELLLRKREIKGERERKTERRKDPLVCCSKLEK
jgi:hypothetical protein